MIAFCVVTFEPIKMYTYFAPQNDLLNLSFVKVGKKNDKKWSINGHLSFENFGNHPLRRYLKARKLYTGWLSREFFFISFGGT